MNEIREKRLITITVPFELNNSFLNEIKFLGITNLIDFITELWKLYITIIKHLHDGATIKAEYDLGGQKGKILKVEIQSPLFNRHKSIIKK